MWVGFALLGVVTLISLLATNDLEARVDEAHRLHHQISTMERLEDARENAHSQIELAVATAQIRAVSGMTATGADVPHAIDELESEYQEAYEAGEHATDNGLSLQHQLDVWGTLASAAILMTCFRSIRRESKLREAHVEERLAHEVQLRELNKQLADRVEERTDQLARSQEQLLQAQKMDAVGRLAGGIAHDFNNLLTVILGHTEMLCETVTDPVLLADIEEIKSSGERAAGLTRQLLAFSRQQLLAPKVVLPHEAIAGMDKLLQRVIGEDVTLTTIEDPEPRPIRVDPGQLGQVILNLAVNARDAMPRGGALTFRIGHTTLRASTPTLAAGDYATIAVTDTGTGMDDATRARIFEPFFTTKGPGKGTGLGLATVFGIVRQSGGAVEVVSELGTGTTFTLWFPVTDVRATSRIQPLRIAPKGGTELVLLVEDEAAVRALARNALKRAGYRVLEAGDGEEALNVANAFDGEIDLLLSDVVMPKKSGGELLAAITPSRPRMKVLFMSGYTDDMIDQQGIDRDFAFLQKPVTSEQMLRKIRDVLDHGLAAVKKAG